MESRTTRNATNITDAYGMNNEALSCYHFTSTDFNLGDIPSGWYIFSCVLNAVFSITATVANLLVLAAIRRTPSLHSPSNTLLFGLALSDLGVGLIVHPLFFAQIFGQGYTERRHFLRGRNRGRNYGKRFVYHFSFDRNRS
ncbi:hypothetical protein OS493_012130 [Desmophyllum pertusum]|uniref:G-protein coupled receptors family 1 profile domain-containing protein n=1 Tax=Desmophyllum pertusum TaxID=174260 RepID=A0A9X0A3P6_9CNID|nr:hypothetical protein OS493_012130 [Desmophyllum pertusum]